MNFWRASGPAPPCEGGALCGKYRGGAWPDVAAFPDSIELTAATTPSKNSFGATPTPDADGPCRGAAP